MDTIGGRIQGLRKQKKLTLYQLGKLVEVSGPAISQFEHNKFIPKSVVLQKLSEALGTTTQYLLTGKDSEEIIIIDQANNNSYTTIDLSNEEFELIMKLRKLNKEDQIRIDERVTLLSELKGGTSFSLTNEEQLSTKERNQA